MFLSDNDIRKAVESGSITIDGFDEKRLQPASYDVLLSNKFVLTDTHASGYTDPFNKIYPRTRDVIVKDGEPFVLHPGMSILGYVHDYVGAKRDHLIQLSGKSSLARVGLIIHNTAGVINPGNYLNITLELSNASNVPIILRPKMEIAQLLFSRLTSPSSHDWEAPEDGYIDVKTYSKPSNTEPTGNGIVHNLPIPANPTPGDNKHPEYQYLDLLREIMETGVEKKDHNTGNSLRSVFGKQIRFDLKKGFPLLTTKKVYWKGVLHELFWFLSGQSNIKYLVDNNVHIWDDYPYKLYKKASEKDASLPDMKQVEFIKSIKENDEFAYRWGELPMIYGQQWRRWPTSEGGEIDQIGWILDTIKNFPDRKHAVLSVWNPEYLYAMASPGKALSFPLCHILVHFNVANGRLSCQLYQRSADMFLGVPFNIASYALLTKIMAHMAGLELGDFVHTFGDAHIYGDHFDQVNEQLSREPRPFPQISIDSNIRDLDDFLPEHVTLSGYDPHDSIKGKLTVAGGFDEKDRITNNPNSPN